MEHFIKLLVKITNKHYLVLFKHNSDSAKIKPMKSERNHRL